MIAAELAHRRFVQLKQNFTQLLGFRIAGCEALSVNLTQRADEGVAVLVADFAVVVAMTIVQTCLAHAALPSGRKRQHPPAGLRWQLRLRDVRSIVISAFGTQRRFAAMRNLVRYQRHTGPDKPSAGGRVMGSRPTKLIGCTGLHPGRETRSFP